MTVCWPRTEEREGCAMPPSWNRPSAVPVSITLTVLLTSLNWLLFTPLAWFVTIRLLMETSERASQSGSHFSS